MPVTIESADVGERKVLPFVHILVLEDDKIQTLHRSKESPTKKEYLVFAVQVKNLYFLTNN